MYSHLHGRSHGQLHPNYGQIPSLGVGTAAGAADAQAAADEEAAAAGRTSPQIDPVLFMQFLTTAINAGGTIIGTVSNAINQAGGDSNNISPDTLALINILQSNQDQGRQAGFTGNTAAQQQSAVEQQALLLRLQQQLQEEQGGGDDMAPWVWPVVTGLGVISLVALFAAFQKRGRGALRHYAY